MVKRLTGVVVAVVMIGGACGGDGGGSDFAGRDEAIDGLAESMGIGDSDATCIVDGIVEDLGADRVRELSGDAEPTGEETLKLIDAMDDCDLGAGDLLDDRDVQDFADELGISTDVARCVFNEMGAEFFALGSSGGEPSTELLRQVFDAAESCGG